jgi:3',5'-cyclic AMP phosphodiesterase CpdA
VCGATGDEATAQILDSIEGTVFTLGDNVYPNGTLEQFMDCYEPSWGRHKARTRPVPGNHDYNTPGAAGYYAYFGEAAGDPSKGYYTYELGEWLVIVLNSEVDTDENSEQAQWLRDVLAQNPRQCTVAMMHRPLFSSGPHGRDGTGDKTRPLWTILYENGVEMVLSGHDHNYERFAPQNPQGEMDTARGVRQFVVGTGGAVPYPFGDSKPNSERRIAGPFGVLKLTLHPASYEWDYVSISPVAFRDSGQADCH